MGDPLADAAERAEPAQPAAADHEQVDIGGRVDQDLDRIAVGDGQVGHVAAERREVDLPAGGGERLEGGADQPAAATPARSTVARWSRLVAMATVVVGVDGSEGARAAARFALEEARLRGATLVVAAAWHVPAAAYAAGIAPPPELGQDLERAARTAVEQVRDELGGGADVPVETIVREGQAADVLVEESAGADLLVVGSRGLGGFRGLLLGSVGIQCAHHARCPLAIVRPQPA